MKLKRACCKAAGILFIICSVFLLTGCFVWQTKPEKSLLKYEFAYVKDGDTICVKNAKGELVTVRLIGIDAPESVAPEEYTEKTGKENSKYGEMAAEHLAGLLTEGEKVILEYDQETADSYDRDLAYVYKGDTMDLANMINAKMLEDGYAVTMEIPPNTTYCKEFLEAQKQAESAGKGLWQYGDFMSGEKGTEE